MGGRSPKFGFARFCPSVSFFLGGELRKFDLVAEDLAHSTEREKRYFCFGKVGAGVLTVRFTYRQEVIRIFGAGYWTRGLRLYEKVNKVHK